MDTLENIPSKLNELLETDSFDEQQFDLLVKSLKEQFNAKIGLIDFKYFNERRQYNAHKEKLKGVQSQNFEYCANQRILERICQKHIELKKLFGIKKSMFLFEKNFLLFCHCGTSKNDEVIMQYLMEDERYMKLNIKV